MVLVEAKRGPRGQGWWGAAIMAARREPLLGAECARGLAGGRATTLFPGGRSELSFDCRHLWLWGAVTALGVGGRGRATEGAAQGDRGALPGPPTQREVETKEGNGQRRSKPAKRLQA